MTILKMRAIIIFDYLIDSKLDQNLTPKQIAKLEAECFNDDVLSIEDHLEVGQYEAFVKPINQK